MKVSVGQYPEDKYLLIPFGGWISNTLYLVKISPSRRTPVYEAVLYSGTISDDGNLNATYKVWSPIHGEYGDHPSALLYLEAVQDLI